MSKDVMKRFIVLLGCTLDFGPCHSRLPGA
jgi:hypothetical protein